MLCNADRNTPNSKVLSLAGEDSSAQRPVLDTPNLLSIILT